MLPSRSKTCALHSTALYLNIKSERDKVSKSKSKDREEEL